MRQKVVFALIEKIINEVCIDNLICSDKFTPIGSLLIPTINKISEENEFELIVC
ncbi:MAG: hypothetical protein RMJ51_04260 [Candidatus Calescibacterium sp.]|nr:hypothetical protein [Candidatus Calescibacterium sp.]MCX7971981.1 hypothetical protein [bacterium]MDW8195433.1 hypothetical protein [Candidatus Calescibacterium sp.]